MTTWEKTHNLYFFEQSLSLDENWEEHTEQLRREAGLPPTPKLQDSPQLQALRHIPLPNPNTERGRIALQKIQTTIDQLVADNDPTSPPADIPSSFLLVYQARQANAKKTSHNPIRQAKQTLKAFKQIKCGLITTTTSGQQDVYLCRQSTCSRAACHHKSFHKRKQTRARIFKEITAIANRDGTTPVLITPIHLWPKPKGRQARTTPQTAHNSISLLKERQETNKRHIAQLVKHLNLHAVVNDEVSFILLPLLRFSPNPHSHIIAAVHDVQSFTVKANQAWKSIAGPLASHVSVEPLYNQDALPAYLAKRAQVSRSKRLGSAHISIKDTTPLHALILAVDQRSLQELVEHLDAMAREVRVKKTNSPICLGKVKGIRQQTLRSAVQGNSLINQMDRYELMGKGKGRVAARMIPHINQWDGYEMGGDRGSKKKVQLRMRWRTPTRLGSSAVVRVWMVQSRFGSLRRRDNPFGIPPVSPPVNPPLTEDIEACTN